MKKIIIKTRLSLMFFMIVNSFAFAQTTMILQPDSDAGKDAFLNENHPNTNYGNATIFISYSWTFSGDAGRGYSLLQFDLSTLPVNSKIQNAELSLYHNARSGSAGQAGNNACYLKKITSDWNENLVTWNTIPTSTNANQILLTRSSSPNQDYPNIDLTNFVTDWYNNPQSNYGMLLELIDQSLYNSMKFCSSDCLDSTLRPKLEITYTVDVDEPEPPIPVNPEKEKDFNLFSNPSFGLVTIELIGFSSEIVSMDIINSTGQYVKKISNLNIEQEFDLSDLAKGVYFVRVFSDGFSATKKLIII